MRRCSAFALAFAAFAVGAPAAAQSIEHQRIEYERQQREYWRAQEAKQLEQQRQQQMWEDQRKREEASRAQQGSGAKPGYGPDPTGTPGPSYGSGGDAAAEVEALRSTLEKQPALAPERNPLLGQWRLMPRTKTGTPGGLGDLLAMVSGSACEMLLGDGIWDFRPQAIYGIDQGVGETRLDQAQYRGSGSMVAVLPRRFVRLMVFEFQTPNRARFTLGGGCVMERVGTQQAARGKAQAQQAANATPLPSASGRPAQEVCSLTLLDKLGTVRVEQVRQVLGIRYKETLKGTVPGTGQLRLDARGSGCDDPRLQATLYDFDANGVLRMMTYVWARPPSPAPAPIFGERVRALSLHHPSLPPPQSAGRLQADTSLGRLVLQDLPERGLLLEAYVAKR